MRGNRESLGESGDDSMRDILFRAWDKDAGNYFYFSLEDLNYGRVKMTLSSCVVERFTGFLDKNGRKIYEGDIVRCFEDFVQPVEWRDGGFGYDVCGDLVYFGHNIYFNWKDGQSKEIEVLGNIWENPRLIEELKAETKE
jgi:hypothetical protein